MKEKAWPPLPVNEGVQTKCWKLVLVLALLYYFILMIVHLADGMVGSFFMDILAVILFIMMQYHSLYYTIDINEESINIRGGPCQWCEDWSSKDDPKHWISATWCFSSQISKSDIVSIETRIVQYYPDWFPRFYCFPVVWCCCHKSYSGWYFPWCCADIDAFGMCDGDIGSVTQLKYVQFNLSEGTTDFIPGNNCGLECERCSANLMSGFAYNRISYVLRDPSVVDQLKQCGYQVLELSGGGGSMVANNNTATGGAGAAAAAGSGQTNDAVVDSYNTNNNTQQQQQAPQQTNTYGADANDNNTNNGAADTNTATTTADDNGATEVAPATTGGDDGNV